MKYLESIRVVQFFLFERQELRLSEITGIFGPNGSGKSSMLDAVQIAMLGANSRLVALNAQANEQATTRSLRAYCLGQYGESTEHRARENATTYITLIWRDSETGAPLSMGVCIYAAADKEGHDVLGRYILPGVELAMSDHLEVVNGEERPREWSIFRHQLVERAQVSGEDPLFSDAQRYIQASLLALRGSGSPPHTESFTRAFRFALRMRFDKTVDQIVRNDVLESRPTNIKKFREVTESFRRLAELVAQVEAKLNDGRLVEAEFDKATEESRRANSWHAIAKMAAVEVARDIVEQANEARNKAEDDLGSKAAEHNAVASQIAQAKIEVSRYRKGREAHTAHKDYGLLQSEIQATTEREYAKSSELRASLNLVRRTLEDAAGSSFLGNHAVALRAAEKSLAPLPDQLQKLNRDEIATALRPNLRLAEVVVNELFQQGSSLEYQLKKANESLSEAEDALKRVKEGRPPLSSHVQRLLSELRDRGLSPTPVCDLVRIKDAGWQPIIESYLGPHVESLLIPSGQEGDAYQIYRGTTIYGAKMALESRQVIGNSVPGSVAELIEGENREAVAYLRRQFGDLMRANTEAEALAGKRTLTRDGMHLSSGDLDRIRPKRSDELKIGADSSSYRENALRQRAACKQEVDRLTALQQSLMKVLNSVRVIANETLVMQRVFELLDEIEIAQRDVLDKKRQMESRADAEYVRLGEQEQYWSAQLSSLEAQIEPLTLAKGRAEKELENRISAEDMARDKQRHAALEAEEARCHPEYDKAFWARQWDALTERFGASYTEMEVYAHKQQDDAKRRMNLAIQKGVREFGTFLEKYCEQAPIDTSSDWIKSKVWLTELLDRLDKTELAGFREDMDAAYRTSQETFRNDVAIALSNNLEWLEETMDRLNSVLKSCPTFSNGERYRFRRVVRPQLESLLRFVKDVAAFGPTQDLLGGAGEIPEAFKQLLEDKIAPGSAGVRSPLDDYREFFEFDIEILREDPLTMTSKVVGHLSKRLGPGSGGEHRAPLYVIAGAALASAYRLDRGNQDGLRLMLLDEAFNKMDMTNIIATMRYLEELGLQVFMASPGENLGTLTAFLHRYYDILRDADNNTVMIEGHDVSAEVRSLFREDLPEFNPDLIENELAAVRLSSAIGTNAGDLVS